MATGVRADTSKRLGALLLKGWAMLAENCPDCQVPLMKERGSEERLCVNCDTTFVPEGQGLRPVSQDGEPQQEQPATQQHPSPPPPEPSARTAAAPGLGRSGEGNQQKEGATGGDTGADEDAMYEDVQSYDPLADSRLGPFAASLSGGTPPVGVADGKQRQLSAVPDEDFETKRESLYSDAGRAGRNGVDDVGTQAVGTTTAAVAAGAAGLVRGDQGRLATGAPSAAAAAAASSSSTAAAAPAFASGPSSAAGAVSADEVADRLSTRMLQGWALLDKHCPRCSNLLVRSKGTRRMFCVACDAWVLTEADLANQQQQQPQQQQPQQPQPQQQQLQQQLQPSSSQPPLKPAAAASPPAAAQQLRAAPSLSPSQAPRPEASQRLPGPVGQSPPVGQAGSHQPMGNGWVGSGGDGGGERGGRRGCRPKQLISGQLLVDIGRTVELKILEAQGLLERTPALNTERARSYVALIGECLDLVGRLQGLQQQQQ